MPSQHSAAISYKMIKSMSRAKVIGPLLIGLGLPIEIAPLRTSTSEIINLASIAAYSADLLITSQLRTALILNKNIKATNYQIDTFKKKIYLYGIAMNSDEKELVISEAKEILDVQDVIASIMLVEDLRIQKN